MSRASSFITSLIGFVPQTRQRIFLDFGSVNTRIVAGSKVIYEEPTCVSIHKQTRAVISTGQKALSSWKKTPSTITTIFPVQGGVVAHQEEAEKYLEQVLAEITNFQKSFLSGLKASLLKFVGNYALGVDVSPVEKQVFREVLKNVGLGDLKKVNKTQAFFKRINPKNSTKASFCSLDVGGQTTELGIFVEGEEVFARTFSWGSFSFTERIRQIVLAKYHLEISWEMAENIKKQIGQVFIDEKRDQKLKANQLAIRGKDILLNSVKTIIVSADDFASDFLDISREFMDELKLSFEKVSAEVMTQALSNGFFLTGGGSKLIDFDILLRAEFKCEVVVSKTPELDIVKGLGI